MSLSQLESRVIELSIMYKLGHVPSALTQVQYISDCLSLTKGFARVAGKPFGAQAWYAALGLANKPLALLQPPLVQWNCETIGHALGYALGLATGTKVWLNLSDASLEAGDFWESLQLWHKLPRTCLFVTVDCNGFGCKHKTTSIEGLSARINSFGVPCIITKKVDRIFDGITLVDTSDTLGARMKAAGFHYEHFDTEEEFYAQCRERMVNI